MFLPFWLYFYDQQGKLIAEKDQSSGLFKDYIYLENEPVARIDNKGVNNDSLSFYHNDHLGTPIVLTNSGGTVLLRTEYFAFGKVYSQTGTGSNNIRFPGQYFDAESNLHQNWWRDYDPKIGRYREVDPLTVSPSILNVSVYGYASNRSTLLVDPKGLRVATSLCTKDQDALIQKAAQAAEAAALSSCIDCNLKRYPWKRKIRETTYHCATQFEAKLSGIPSACGWKRDPHGNYTGRDMTLYDSAFSEQDPEDCGCLQGTIFHEIAHFFGIEHPANYSITKECFSCAANPDQFRVQ